jgi:hypothetical protein
MLEEIEGGSRVITRTADGVTLFGVCHRNDLPQAGLLFEA